MVWAGGGGVEVEIFAGRFEVATDHFRVDADRAAHFVDEHCHFVAATAFALDDTAGVDFAVKVFVPCYSFGGPGEDGAEALNVAPVRAADVAYREGGRGDHGREGGDESRGFVDAGEAGIAHLECVDDWVAIGAFVAFSGFVELVDRVDDRVVKHLTAVGSFLSLHWSGGVGSVHVSTDVHPIDIASS